MPWMCGNKSAFAASGAKYHADTGRTPANEADASALCAPARHTSALGVTRLAGSVKRKPFDLPFPALRARFMTDHTQLIAVVVAEVCAVVVLVIMGPKRRRALVFATLPQGDSVRFLDGLVSAGREGNHVPIAGVMRLTIVGNPDNEQWPRLARALSHCPWTRRVE